MERTINKPITDDLRPYAQPSIKDVVNITLFTDPEELKLFIALTRLGTEPISEEMVVNAIRPKVDLTLIDMGVLHEAIKSSNASPPEVALPRRIAKGKASVPALGGKLLLLAKALISPDANRSPSSQNHNRDNIGPPEESGMYELHLFDNIEPQRVIGRIYPPKPGVDGHTAYGKKIPAIDEKPIAVIIDGTITREPPTEKNPFETLRANTSGYLEKKGLSLSIKEELVIRGDVDFHTGNIDFINQIKITGDVGSGFHVRGKKGVMITGGVQNGSTIISKEGSVTIGGYLVGSRIEAQGNVTVANIQEADIETQSWVMIGKQSAESLIRTAGGVIADKAHIFGGTIHCVEGCTIGTLGNHVGLSTKINLTTKSSVTSAFSSLQTQVTSHESAAALLKAHLGPYAQNPMRIELLHQPHRSKMQTLFAKLQYIEKSLLLLVEELKKYDDEPLAENARVTFTKKAYPGVTIQSGEALLTLQEEISKPKTIKRVEGALTIVEPDALLQPDLAKPNEKQHGKM